MIVISSGDGLVLKVKLIGIAMMGRRQPKRRKRQPPLSKVKARGLESPPYFLFKKKFLVIVVMHCPPAGSQADKGYCLRLYLLFLIPPYPSVPFGGASDAAEPVAP